VTAENFATNPILQRSRHRKASLVSGDDDPGAVSSGPVRDCTPNPSATACDENCLRT
jgi:hypothetical protein